jgi:copper(I)-binding protein
MTDADVRARVEALELTVATLRQDLRRTRAPGRIAPATLLWAVTVALAVAGSAAIRAADNAPLIVGPAGIVVTNAEGRPALTLQSLPGQGGRVAVFNGSGEPIAQLVGSSNACCARLEMLHTSDGKPRVIIGVAGTDGAIRMRGDTEAYSQISADGYALHGETGDDPIVAIRDDGSGGMIRLRSASGAPALLLTSEDGNGLMRAYGASGIATVLGSSNGIGMLRLNSTKAQAAILEQGDGRIYFTNAGGTGVMAIGANDNGGYMVALNNAGKEASTVSVEPDGSGRVQLWRTGELSLIAGTTDGRGDLCVNGAKGKLCMGLLAVKTFTPY